MARDAIRIREDIVADSIIFSTIDSLSTGRIGAITGTLNKYLGGDNNRKYVNAWLFLGIALLPLSSKSLTYGQFAALEKWIGAYQEEGVWRPSIDFVIESTKVLQATSQSYLDTHQGIPVDMWEMDTALVLAGIELGGKVRPI